MQYQRQPGALERDGAGIHTPARATPAHGSSLTGREARRPRRLAFLTHLAVKEKVRASKQNQALTPFAEVVLCRSA